MDSAPLVLVPGNCQSSYGPPKDSVSSACVVCITELRDNRIPVITHNSCRTSFCASCLLKWHIGSQKVPTCPTCRGELGIDLTAPGHDPDNWEVYLVWEHIGQVREVVGTDVFDRTPPEDRFISVLPLRSALKGLRQSNVSLPMADQPELHHYHLTNTDLPVEPLERLACFAAARTIYHWIHVQGVSHVQDFRFLEYDGNTHFYVPVMPKVRAFASVQDLAEHIRQRERYVDPRKVFNLGAWLVTFADTDFLKRKISPDDTASWSIIEGLADNEITRMYPTIWVFYSPGDSMDNIIYACPRQVFYVLYSGLWNAPAPSIPGYVRFFLRRDGKRHRNPGRADDDPPLPSRHKLLYDIEFAFPLIDDIGISSLIPSGNTDMTVGEDAVFPGRFE